MAVPFVEGTRAAKGVCVRVGRPQWLAIAQYWPTLLAAQTSARVRPGSSRRADDAPSELQFLRNAQGQRMARRGAHDDRTEWVNSDLIQTNSGCCPIYSCVLRDVSRIDQFWNASRSLRSRGC